MQDKTGLWQQHAYCNGQLPWQHPDSKKMRICVDLVFECNVHKEKEKKPWGVGGAILGE